MRRPEPALEALTAGLSHDPARLRAIVVTQRRQYAAALEAAAVLCELVAGAELAAAVRGLAGAHGLDGPPAGAAPVWPAAARAGAEAGRVPPAPADDAAIEDLARQVLEVLGRGPASGTLIRATVGIGFARWELVRDRLCRSGDVRAIGRGRAARWALARPRAADQKAGAA